MMGLEGYMESSGKPKLLIHAHRHNLKTRFELIKTLGEGTYGKVKLAVEKKTGEQVAIKYIKKNKIKDDTDLNRIQREIRIMSSLCHPYIINVREVFENKERIILIMDCATGGELYEYINDQVKLTEKDARRIFRQIVSAVCYCHQNGIVHRDLKLENIVLDEQQNVKIADFGLSNYYSTNDLLSTFCGSPLYASPEIVNGQAYHGPEVDCWSLGVVLYTLVYGTMPFDSTDFPTLKRQISCGDYYEPTQPSEAAGLIRHLLTVNPQKRAKMNDILNHWWVNLGFKQNPNDEPYPVPELLKPTSLRMSHVTSSDNESDVEQTHVSQPLKGILKKPKSFGSEKESTNQHKEPLSRHRNNCSDNMQTLEKGPELKCDLENNCEKMLDSENNEEKVFDSEKKPVRGILKWTGRFTAPGEVKGKVKSMRENLNARRQRDSNDPPNNPKMPDISGADLTQILHQEHSTDNDNAAQHSTTNKASGTSSVILQKRNLRKTSQTDDRKRLSACSLGSNSSAEILDFSYDSSDENCLSITKCLTPNTNTETTGNGLKGFDICDGFGMEDQCQSLEDEVMRKNSADSSVFDPEEARLVLAQALSIRDKNCR